METHTSEAKALKVNLPRLVEYISVSSKDQWISAWFLWGSEYFLCQNLAFKISSADEFYKITGSAKYDFSSDHFYTRLYRTAVLEKKESWFSISIMKMSVV